jgi:hypothetical protein
LSNIAVRLVLFKLGTRKCSVFSLWCFYR